MSDRTEAEIFGKLFRLLAENVTRDRRDIANEMFYLAINGYECDPRHMRADEALCDLELSSACENCNKMTYEDVEHECD